MGMMHEGYFVGRKELINWIRDYFEPGFSKIEDLASGVVYCQIIDNIYPGSVPMSKVKTTAKTEVDFIQNFKILQTAFGKKKIERYIDVDKLTKRSFQYNMEFLQFMKCYWDMVSHANNIRTSIVKRAWMTLALARHSTRQTVWSQRQSSKRTVPTSSRSNSRRPSSQSPSR